MQWFNNKLYRNNEIYLNDIDDYVTSRLTVQFTVIHWIDGKPSRWFSDWIDIDFDVDQNPDFYDIPF